MLGRCFCKCQSKFCFCAPRAHTKQHRILSFAKAADPLTTSHLLTGPPEGKKPSAQPLEVSGHLSRSREPRRQKGQLVICQLSHPRAVFLHRAARFKRPDSSETTCKQATYFPVAVNSIPGGHGRIQRGSCCDPERQLLHETASQARDSSPGPPRVCLLKLCDLPVRNLKMEERRLNPW